MANRFGVMDGGVGDFTQNVGSQGVQLARYARDRKGNGIGGEFLNGNGGLPRQGVVVVDGHAKGRLEEFVKLTLPLPSDVAINSLQQVALLPQQVKIIVHLT